MVTNPKNRDSEAKISENLKQTNRKTQAMCYYTAYVYKVCGHVSLSEYPVHNSPCSKISSGHGSGSRPRSLPPTKDRPAEPIERPVSVNPALIPPRLPETAPQATCDEKLVHAMHTLTLEKLCGICEADREARLTSFQTRMRDDMGQRISTRLTSLNNGTGWRGRQFRATSTSSPRPVMVATATGFSSGSSQGEACDDDERPSTSLTSRRPSATESVQTDVSVATGSGSGASIQDAFGSFMRGVKGGWNVPDGRSLFSPSLSSREHQSTFASPVSPRSRTPVVGLVVTAHSSGQSIDAKDSLPESGSGGRAVLSFGRLGG